MQIKQAIERQFPGESDPPALHAMCQAACHNRAQGEFLQAFNVIMMPTAISVYCRHGSARQQPSCAALQGVVLLDGPCPKS